MNDSPLTPFVLAMKNYPFFALPLVLCVLIFSGCGSKNYQLTGKVTFSDDGSPVPAGTIFFTDGAFMSQGAIKPDGTYVVGTMDKTDGIPPGEYKVYFGGVNSVEEYDPYGDGFTQAKYTPLIDSKYASADTSGLTFTADGKTKTFDVQLDRAK